MADQRFDTPEHRAKIGELEAQDYAPNTYPTRTSLHMRRHNLELVEDEEGKVQGTLGNEEICMICEEEGSEEKELFSCDGQISGEMEDGRLMALEERSFRACNSKFHLECIMAYNAGNIDFHYAARTECQGKFLCPLHCCSVCNIEHKKQSAYEAELIECAYCFRAFHSKCCYPAGSKPVKVTMDFEERATFQMLVCPSHCPSAPASHHIPACCKPDCMKNGALQSCRSCIRSFHPRCREVRQINEANAPKDQCDVCASEGVIVVGTPIVALCPGTNEFHMGIVGRGASQLGAVEVEWLMHGRSIGKYEVGLSHVVEVQESYFRLAPGNQKSYWETTFDDWKDTHYVRHPIVFKLVFTEVETSIPAPRNRKVVPLKTTSDKCDCGDKSDCKLEDCPNALAGHECPPSCARNKEGGFVCHNSRISTGYINPKIELKKTKKKGWGVFATARIEAGEFLAGFHGEVCDEEEFRRRDAVKRESKDEQYIYQFMDHYNGFTLDMSTHGNISRYANNSCSNPNAMMLMKDSCTRTEKNRLVLEKRCYLEAKKAIKRGEEVTIKYGDKNNGSPCFCDSCKPVVDPKELQWDKNAKDD
ncbi:unnamed protein product [Caenorhabditis brenneri]